ncbi:MAG: glutaminyl-tRNA synthase (glutamine-hydrolyzing) subunit B [Candidatus Komeilibacteria bacterium RIFCSPLOWO2_02_FULL_48_11]|uniref:Aspartyl/glutamyl-tRNA(Asn/Gln) amidotransferase subunit B n=1 Tax=Candidatus Komeilibacteria bacterium RIFCSPLOWO2_02_FULL_48_11 TaxID=1798553 RepID=A0A1G2BS32_9BACT|nr:MAG: glutaminyl-tRNA synthase (glutamine-hydrolyzing) subunit B [Candidatus Komeilibacteria bacterium RIFCSPLOWO2_02_FULL_48_11]
MKLENIIGLEIHVQLKTKSKMFCSCSNKGEDLPPNTTVCPVCLGHPGTLPVPNEQAIEWSVKSALALNCEIPRHSKFDRKHYFYPDLPKAYQISQYDEPIGINGYLEIILNGEKRKIRIHRLHLEEDAAKLLHNDKGESFVDFNRGGTPLMEIVTEPDIRTPEEAGEFLRELRLSMRYLGVSEADMEKGHLRCDANISMRPMSSHDHPPTPSLVKEGEVLYPKTEIKNLNSFKAAERALAYEIMRQTKVWEETGQAPEVQGTRGWDESGKTIVQRIKEEANDYRYFPEPDIPELDFSPDWVEKIKAELPELPAALRQRFIKQYGFNSIDAKIISQDKALASFVEKVVSELLGWLESSGEEGSAEEIWEKNKAKLSKLVAGWVLSKLLGALNKASRTLSDITPENMAELITLVYQSKVNSTNAAAILSEVLSSGESPTEIMESKDLGQMLGQEGLEGIIDKIIADNPKQVEQYRSGKEAVLQYLVGQVMKQTHGKADAAAVQELLKNKLG